MLSYIFAIKYLRIMETRRDVFQAIADPTRRAILGMIAQQPVNVNNIAENFDVSRQAISLHLKILTECDLLNVKQSGRERLYEAKLEKLNEVHEWVEQYRKIWLDRFNALHDFIEEENSKKTITNEKNNQNGKSKK